MARTPYEYLWVLLAIEPDQGQVWIRQGNPDVLGMGRSDLPMEFERWNAVLNQLGGQGWDVVSSELIQGETSHEQLWLLKRELQ
jgi:hypothetical protein